MEANHHHHHHLSTHQKKPDVPESLLEKTTTLLDYNFKENVTKNKSNIDSRLSVNDNYNKNDDGVIKRRKSSITINLNESKNVLDATMSAVNTLVKESQNLSQEERRAQLKEKKVLFVCCGHDGLDSKKFVFKRASSLGVRTYLIEETHNTLAKEMETENVVDKFIKVDMTPRSNLLEDCMASLAPVLQEIGNFDGICTFWDDAVGLCARIGQKLNLPGSSINSVDIAHDKHLTREAMRKAGLPTPASYLLKSEKDLKKAAEIVGAPAILKPMYGASSLGVIKVEKIESLEETYNSVVHMLREFYEEGELMGLTFDDDNKVKNETNQSFENSSLNWLVMEEFIDGDEVDVDLVMKDGKVLYQCVVDDWPQIEPWFAEMGNSCPSLLPENIQNGLIKMAIETSIKAMGFTDGILHCELKNSSKGAQIIEINPRMGGGPVWLLHKLAFGLDLIEETLYSCLKIKGRPISPNKPYQSVCCGEKFFENSMEVPKEFCQLIEAISQFPNVIESIALVKPNEKIIGIADAFPTRCARFTVYGDSPIEAKIYAEQLLSMCDIPQVTRAQKSFKKHEK